MPAVHTEWTSLALLGSLHGVNPAMGWLFAVSLGLQAQSGRAVWSALAPLALGHALAVAAALAAAAVLDIVFPPALMKWAAAGALLGFGILHLRPHTHLKWAMGGMCVGPRQLTTWSFLVSSAHGAGLMVLPFVLRPGTAGADAHARHGAEGHTAHLAGVAVTGDHTAALVATLVHTAAYLAVAGALAWVVYARLGLRFLRGAWINMNVVWAAALILAAVATAVHGQGKSRDGAWAFVNARYDTRSSGSVYAGSGWGPAFAMGGVMHNPRSASADLLGGVGAVVRTGAHAEHWLALAAARTAAGSTAQLYWLPTVRTGNVTTRAQVKWTIPHAGRAAQKLALSPLSMTLPVWRRFAAGVAVEVAAAEGARTSIGTGPQLRFKLPRAVVGADALREVTGNGSRMRLFFGSSL